MLDPDYIQKLSERAEEIASQLHTDIIRRVIQRIMLRLQRKDDYLLTAVDKWQLETLQEAGFLREDLVKEIAKATGQQVSEIKRAFEDAGVKTIAWDNAVYKAAWLSPDPLLNSPQLLAVLDRGYRKTLQEWRNYTGTTATAAQQLFIQVCDRAHNQVISGSLPYTQAVAEAVETVAKSGVVVHYPTGWKDTIETATLRAVRTGVGQACAEMSEARMEELNWDIVLTSAHLGARYGDGGENYTNHAWWQGKFYSRSGKDKRFPPLSVCGMGDVQGLCGANCRHSIGPGDGENNPYEGYDSEENRKRYDLEQRQRQLERRIRNTKREVQGLKAAVDAADPETRPVLEEKYQKKAKILQRQNKAYNQFCAENGLKPLQDRLKIAGWDRKQAASATAAAAPPKTVTNTPTRVENPVMGCNDVTQAWMDTATPGSHKVAEVKYFEQDGVRYRVDGKDVKFEYTLHEKEIAELLESKLGGKVQLMPKVQGRYKGISTPDLLFHGQRLDIKTPEKWQKKTIFNAVHKKREQADNFLFDISQCGASETEVLESIAQLFNDRYAGFVQRIFLVKDKEILKIFERKK